MRSRKYALLILVLAVLSAALIAAQSSVSDLLKRADAAFAAEDRALAERLYRQVLELDPDQSHAVYRLAQLTRNDERALRLFLRYAQLEPDDAWGWLAVGDKYLRLGKAVEAREAYQRAVKLAPQAEDVKERLAKGRLRAAPGFEPIGGYEKDSDGNRTWRAGLNGDVAIRGGFRLGVRALRADISDGTAGAKVDEAVARLEGRPQMALRLDLTLGAARLAAGQMNKWITPVADFRLRWRSPDGGPAVELRAQRLALGTTPVLVANRAMRNDARLVLELPLGPLRIRAGGRAGFINTLTEQANARLEGDAAIAIPIGWRGEFSAQYHRLGFTRASNAGYFAPSLVETFEGGTYWELGGDGRASAALDLGMGIQRLAEQGERLGPWKPALRGWGMLTVDLSRTVQWRLEGEAYSAPFAPIGAVTAPNWRYFSIRLGLLFRIL